MREFVAFTIIALLVLVMVGMLGVAVWQITTKVANRSAASAGQGEFYLNTKTGQIEFRRYGAPL